MAFLNNELASYGILSGAIILADRKFFILTLSFVSFLNLRKITPL